MNINKIFFLILKNIVIFYTFHVNAIFFDYKTYEFLQKELGFVNLTNEVINFYAPLIEENNQYLYFPDEERIRLKKMVKEMFEFGYDNYMEHAWPLDELDSIHCRGRGPDYENPSNININDVLGDYMLTLVDSLDTLVIMGNSTEFKKAVNLIIQNLSFDKNNTVQVFESTIRVLGSLLSAHLILIDKNQPFGNMSIAEYDSELLTLAHDLGSRLLSAFANTTIPYPRINLMSGVPSDTFNHTCTSGAGSLLLEFGMLSRLTGDPVYEMVARKAVKAIYNNKDNVTGLLGNEIHVKTGEWLSNLSGLGAGLDSYYEYLLKSFILFGEKIDYEMFSDIYENVKTFLRRGRKECNGNGYGMHPIYLNVNMKNGQVINNWIDSLQASFPGVQVLNGDIEEAICFHSLYYAIWKKFGVLPERYNWNLKLPDVYFYPLRPEFVESTYFLYQATKSPFYLYVAKHVLENLYNLTKVKCGFATIHDVLDKSLEDRMESFFLSETLKYLYLIFDKENYLNNDGELRYVFTTEGHLFPIEEKFHTNNILTNKNLNKDTCQLNNNYLNNLPLQTKYLRQVFDMVGVYDDVNKLLDRKN